MSLILKKRCFNKIGNFHFYYINFLKSHFVEYVKFAKRCWWNNGTGNFICLYITWKKWNFIHKFPPIKIQLNIWIMSLHKNSKKWQNKQNGATSWMLKAIKKWIWMLFWVESLKFMMLPTCQSKIFLRFQKFTFFEFPNHDGHSTALWTGSHIKIFSKSSNCC